jgi:hypothetical protein
MIPYFLYPKFKQYYLTHNHKLLNILEESGLFLTGCPKHIDIMIIAMAIENNNAYLWYLLGQNLICPNMEDLIGWYGITQDIINILLSSTTIPIK